jgi:hypothetical protein
MPCWRITRSIRLRPTVWPSGTQRGTNTRCPVSAPVLCMNPPDIGQQRAIGDLARALWP